MHSPAVLPKAMLCDYQMMHNKLFEQELCANRNVTRNHRYWLGE